jgi:hypothetical protein
VSESWIDRMSAVASRKSGAPKGWRGWIFRKAEQGGLFVTGAVCPPITRGPNKGNPNYRKHDKNTKMVIYLSEQECK